MLAERLDPLSKVPLLISVSQFDLVLNAASFAEHSILRSAEARRLIGRECLFVRLADDVHRHERVVVPDISQRRILLEYHGARGGERDAKPSFARPQLLHQPRIFEAMRRMQSQFLGERWIIP